MDKRDLAISLFDAAVAAADPGAAVTGAMAVHPVPKGASVTLIAVGKAAPAMMRAALAQVPDAAAALVVTHHENDAEVAGAEVVHAGHPVPDQGGLRAGARVLDLLSGLGDGDVVVALISGGGSALLPAPANGLTLEDKIAVNRLLLESGLDIVRMNLIRQQLSQLKGGGFLRQAAPARVLAYLLSDVIGDDLSAIASGPTVAPLGTAADAQAVMQEAGIWERAPEAVRRHLSRAPETVDLPKAENHLIGSNRQSLEAMLAALPDGLPGEIVDDHLTGDVAQAADRILQAGEAATGPKALIFGGETTVRIKGNGQGGRNQELALRVAIGGKGRLPEGWVFLSGGTDGRDGPTDAAGGLVDGGTVGRIDDVDALLANNDSYAALKQAGDLLITKATGTNVADVQVLLLP